MTKLIAVEIVVLVGVCICELLSQHNASNKTKVPEKLPEAEIVSDLPVCELINERTDVVPAKFQVHETKTESKIETKTKEDEHSVFSPAINPRSALDVRVDDDRYEALLMFHKSEQKFSKAKKEFLDRPAKKADETIVAGMTVMKRTLCVVGTVGKFSGCWLAQQPSATAGKQTLPKSGQVLAQKDTF